MSGPRRTKRLAQPEATGEPETHALRWTRRAEADLVAIDDYISASNPVAAARWVETLMARAQEAALSPLSGRVVPELGVRNIREVLVRNYRIVYRIHPGEVQVLTVFEGHRLLRAETPIELEDD
jgi:toxin ParE1/3/4